MRSWRVAVLGVCFFFGLPALAGGFSGTFAGEGGEKIVLSVRGKKVSGQVIVAGTRGKLSGTVAGMKLRGKVTLPWGDSAPFTATLRGDTLKLKLAGDPSVGVYRRVSGGHATRPEAGDTTERRPHAGRQLGPAAGPGPTPAQFAGPGGAASSATRGPGLSATGPRAGGRTYRSEYQGWALKLAPGWNGQEKDGMLLLGSKREAGMIVVQATSERDPQRLRAGLAEDLAEVGLSGPVPSLANSKMPAGTGIMAEFPVRSNDGAALKVRAAGVIGPRGTVAIIGTTTPEHFATLRRRVDAMARSITFFKPKVAPGARFVRGEWYSFTGVGSFTGGSGGTEATLAFCADGSFHDSSESSYAGNGFGVAGAPSGSSGRWRVEGNATQGRVIITTSSGNERVIPYRASGADMNFDGRVYARTGQKVCR